MLLGHLFLEAHNSYFETVNVRGQISVHIFARYRGYYFIFLRHEIHLVIA